GPDDARRARQLCLRRRGRARSARTGRLRGSAARVSRLARDRGADRQRLGRLDARRRLEPDAARADDEPPPRAGRELARAADLRGRRRALPPDQQELVDRRQAPQLPVRDAGRLGDQGRQARPNASRCDLHGADTGLLGHAGRRRGPGRVAPARADELRQGPAGPARARLARDRPGPLPQRPGRLQELSDALDLAQRALRAAEGDEALALANSERSGLARFAGSEVHQPTLIENDVVELQIVRDGRVGVAVANRTDDEGLRALAARAAEAADSAPADPDFPGLAPKAEPPAVEGYDEETAALGPEEQARLAAAAIEASSADLYGFFTSGRTELALASTTGLAVSQAMTDACIFALAAVEGASGHAEKTSWRVSEIDPAEAGQAAVAKAERTRGAIELEPGSYAAVLAPYAFAELLLYFAYDAFGALGL